MKQELNIDPSKIKIEITYQGEHIYGSYLYYRGIKIGETLYSDWKDKYKSKEQWAKKQIKKRLEVCKTNIERLDLEKDDWYYEYDLLNS